MRPGSGAAQAGRRRACCSTPRRCRSTKSVERGPRHGAGRRKLAYGRRGLRRAPFLQPNPRQPASARLKAGFILIMASISPAVASRTNPPAESFAALFEESLTRKEMRIGEVITAEVVRVDHNFVVVNAGLKSESYHPARRIPATTAARSRSSPATSSASPSRRSKTATAKRACRATRPSASPPGSIWRRRSRTATMVKGVITGKVKGGLTVMVNGIRAFLPGSLVDMRPVKDTTPYEGKTMEFKVIKLDRKRNNVVVSRRAVLEAIAGRGAPEAARKPAGRRGRQGHRQEHHRLRRVRGPGRHRRPAAHHRPGLAPREAPVRSAQGRRRGHRQGAQVRRRRRTASRWA